jgi:hypothetical protein
MPSPAAEVARVLIARMREYGAPHSVMPVMASQFGHLNLAEYGRFQSRMESQGFRFIADVEVPEASNMVNTVVAPAMLRMMASADGQVVAAYYQVRPKIGRRLLLVALGLLRLRVIAAPREFFRGIRTRHCVQLHSEFDDGRTLTTSNAEAAAAITPPPSIERHLHPFGTPVATLLAEHRRRFAAIVQGTGGPRPIVVRTLRDLIDMHKRQNARKIAHRKEVGVVTRDEVLRFCARHPALAEAVCTEVEKLLAREPKQAGPSSRGGT